MENHWRLNDLLWISYDPHDAHTVIAYIKFLSPGEQGEDYGRRESCSTHWTRDGGNFFTVFSDHRLAGGRKRDDWESVPAARLAGGRNRSEIKLSRTSSFFTGVLHPEHQSIYSKLWSDENGWKSALYILQTNKTSIPCLGKNVGNRDSPQDV